MANGGLQPLSNPSSEYALTPAGYSPSLKRQLLAAQGYVVLGVNYRESTGCGGRFQQSILADWGHKEMEDLLAAVDHAVAMGIADPAKLRIGGWSQGGMLTDYTIASDAGFKAAISGAGSGSQVGMYVLHQYALQVCGSWRKRSASGTRYGGEIVPTPESLSA